jgi:beta-glucanase (GH16 family)
MKQEQISGRKRSRAYWPAITAQLALVGLLSACGGGNTTEPGVGAASSSNTANEANKDGPSASAAQLSFDANYSIGFAQAVAAGVEDAPEQVSSPEVTLTSSNSGEAIPTTNSSDAAVLITTDLIVVANTDGDESGTDSGSDTDNTDNVVDVDGGTSDVPTNQPIPEIPESALPVVETETPVEEVETPVEEAETPVIEPTTPDSESVEETPASETPATPPSEPETPAVVEPADNPTEEIEPTVVADTETLFHSRTTPGFNGEVLSDSIRVTWPVDPNARGYNVYRQAQFVTSVFTEEYIDEDVFDSSYYYEIQAFDNSDSLYYVATGLTVKATTFGTTDPDSPVPSTDLLDGYDLVFGDEFTGATLDATKWNTSYLWGTDLIINSEEQYYVDILDDPEFGFNPFTFDGDNLTINSIETPSELAGKSLNQPYLSGVITSYDAFKFTYGFVETRAKVTHGRGYWPAFWLLNAYYVDDKPEIDIMEFIGHNQDVVYHTYHYYDSEGLLRSTPSQPTPGVDYTAGFHTYAVEWKPGTIIFYIDNVEVHRVVDSKVSQQEMYVIANTALGGWWAGSPDNTTPFPGEFTIDYIRVYQKSQPYDDILLDDGITQVPYADGIFGTSSPSHRPSIEDWPEGYPDGL